MDYPNDKEVLESFECQEDVSFTWVKLWLQRYATLLTQKQVQVCAYPLLPASVEKLHKDLNEDGRRRLAQFTIHDARTK